MIAPERPIRVLIVDDSALMRKVLSDLLSAGPGVEVAGTARDAEEAIRQVEALAPDVVTLDVEMPGTSGVDAIPRILAVRPVPIAHTGSYATTIRARSAPSAAITAAVCRSTTAPVSPRSRSASVSPTHAIGTSAASSAARAFAPTCTSVSPCSCRRSE